MEEPQKETGKSEKPARDASGGDLEEGSPKESNAKVVDELIADFKEKLKNNKVKMTVGDFIRLMQLRSELKAEQPKEIRVTWVDPAEKEPVNET